MEQDSRELIVAVNARVDQPIEVTTTSGTMVGPLITRAITPRGLEVGPNSYIPWEAIRPKKAYLPLRVETFAERQRVKFGRLRNQH